MTLKLIIIPLTKMKKPDLLFGMPLGVILFYYLMSGDLIESLKLYLFLYAVFGLILSRILFCGHRLQELWTEGS